MGECRQPQSVDSVAHDGQQGWKQGDGSRYRHHHGDSCRESDGRDERDVGKHQAEQGNDDRAAGKDDGTARCRDGFGDGVSHSHAAGQLVLVPSHQEERIVDPDPQPDHCRDGWGDAGDAIEMTEQTDDRKCCGQCEDRHQDGETHRHQTPEHDGEDDHRGRQSDDLAALGLGLGQSAADRTTSLDLDAGSLGGNPRGVQDLLSHLVVDES